MSKRTRPKLITTHEQMVASIKLRVEKYREIDDNGCWLWTASLIHAGYGRLQVTEPSGRSTAWGAHRAAYVAWVGPIPDGLHLDHLCRVRRRVNPSHLEPVTCRENLDRSPVAPSAVKRRQDECVNGHPFDEENTYLMPGRGWRACKTCKTERQRRYRASRAAASEKTNDAA